MLQRSCWKIPKAAMTDDDGAPAFADLVTYDESPQFVYGLAAQWERPDIAAAGGVRESLIQPPKRARFLRTTVRRAAADPAEPDVVLRVKASGVRQSDVVLSANDPVVLFAADEADEIIGMPAMQEAARLIAAENQPEAPAPEGP